MKELLIVNKTQFGYHTDYLKYCEYLRDDFRINYLCFDIGLEKIELPGVNVIYANHNGPKFLRGISFLLIAILHVLKTNCIVFVHYFEYCQLIKCTVPWKKMILDIRSLSISKDGNERIKYDNAIRSATEFFDFVTIISEGLRNKINLDVKKSAILPLGADAISVKNRDYSGKICLLYVGTFNGRNVHQTIIGLKSFLQRNPEYYKITTYNIIGYGSEIERIIEAIAETGLNHIVYIHDRIPHSKLQPFFEKCNIGVSYVPITDYYQHQPVTKTYEYILSGMPCIATRTYENEKIINSDNGVLCNDNPESFADSLEVLTQNLRNYNSQTIIKSIKDCSWSKIVKENLLPILSNMKK